jgi:PAS domain-containing protein
MSSEAHPRAVLTADGSAGAAARIMDLVWPSTCLAVFLGLFGAWYLHLLEIPFTPVAAALCVAIGVHFIGFWILENGVGRRGATAVLAFVHATGVLALAYVWFVIGGPEIPAFLIFFALPVAAAAMTVGRWGRLATVGGTLLLLGLIVLLRASELRWYFERLGLPMETLDRLATMLRSDSVQLEGTRSAAGMTMFSCLLGLTSLICIGTLSGRLAEEALGFQQRLRRTLAALRGRRDLSLDLLNGSPLAEALLLADNGQLVFANTRFQALRLEFPEVVESRVRGDGGRVRCRLRDEEGRLRAAVAHVRHLERDGARIAHVSIEDRGDIRQLAAALDCLADMIVIIDAAEAIAYANAEAQARFPEARVGCPASALNDPNLPNGWWRTAAGTSTPRDLRIGPDRFRGAVTHRREDAGDAALTVVALRREASL